MTKTCVQEAGVMEEATPQHLLVTARIVGRNWAENTATLSQLAAVRYWHYSNNEFLVQCFANDVFGADDSNHAGEGPLPGQKTSEQVWRELGWPYKDWPNSDCIEAFAQAVVEATQEWCVSQFGLPTVTSR